MSYRHRSWCQKLGESIKREAGRRGRPQSANGDVLRPMKQFSSDTLTTLSILPGSLPERLKVSPTKRQKWPPCSSPEDALVLWTPGELWGLVNCCFTNVVLQALMPCEPFRRLKLQQEKPGIGKTDGVVHKLVRLPKVITGRRKLSYEMGGDKQMRRNS